MQELESMLSPLRLFSLMAYPSNEDSQEKFMANRVAKIKKEWPGLTEKHIVQGEKPKDWPQEKWGELVRKCMGQFQDELHRVFSDNDGISSLLDSPAYAESKAEFDFNCYKGKLAGNVLVWIRRMVDSNLPSGASVNKAVFMVEETIVKEWRKGLKAKDWPFHQSFIRQDAWLEFKSVSPLWAAYEYWLAWNKPSHCSPFLLEGYVGFISLAINFKEFGITHLPRGRKDPTLISKETWPQSEGVKLIDLTLKPFPLSTKERKILDSYKAPGSYESSLP
jgi:hypothetical protein